MKTKMKNKMMSDFKKDSGAMKGKMPRKVVKVAKAAMKSGF